MTTNKIYYNYCGYEISDRALNILNKLKSVLMSADQKFTTVDDCLTYLFVDNDFSAIGVFVSDDFSTNDTFYTLDKERVCIVSYLRQLINSKEYKG